ncbi:MAG: preprotein translocase subunit SecD [Clostridiales bacterium]|nr:preprotein translocase subunit SecD [Clostridiales bacterium]MDN5280973.1 preprotein translocase subunit SecD [Candidatus Ozemobacter sp.]
MKSKHSVKVIVVLAVFLFTVLYSLPSTTMWENTFGVLTPDEQSAVPERLLEYSATEDGSAALVKFQVDRMAPVLTGVKNPVKAEDVLNSVADTARKLLVNKGLEAMVINPDYENGNASIRVPGKKPEELKTIVNNTSLYAKMPLALSSIFPRSKITLGLDLKGGIDLVYQVDVNSIQEGDSITDAVKRSVEIIRNRIDMFGIAEPSIKAQEGNRIRIQLPGVKDPERVKKLIQNTAMLQFHLVIDQAITAAQLEPINPENEIVLMKPASPNQQAMWFKLQKRAEVTGRDLKFAKVAFDDMSAPIVYLEFNAEGAAKFAQLTGSHIGEQLAIVLDNKVHSAPVIQTRITGGMATITGRFSLEEAQNLAIVLRAGALPASLIALESRVVGPTLGAESIKAGWSAGVVGAVLVLIFMAFFYKLSGIIADFAVILNTLIIFAVLVFFGGTLTLPGIAGLILTVGMAVDANVIIFERIKEEFRSGKTVRASINAGFDRALSCIIDSNVTTLLTVAILYAFGSGPIRGFATTLGIGLLANIFTAIVCVKLALDLIYSGNKAKTLSI